MWLDSRSEADVTVMSCLGLAPKAAPPTGMTPQHHSSMHWLRRPGSGAEEAPIPLQTRVGEGFELHNFKWHLWLSWGGAGLNKSQCKNVDFLHGDIKHNLHFPLKAWPWNRTIQAYLHLDCLPADYFLMSHVFSVVPPKQPDTFKAVLARPSGKGWTSPISCKPKSQPCILRWVRVGGGPAGEMRACPSSQVQFDHLCHISIAFQPALIARVASLGSAPFCGV